MNYFEQQVGPRFFYFRSINGMLEVVMAESLDRNEAEAEVSKYTFVKWSSDGKRTVAMPVFA